MYKFQIAYQSKQKAAENLRTYWVLRKKNKRGGGESCEILKKSDKPLVGGDMLCSQCNADAHAAYFTDCTKTFPLSDDYAQHIKPSGYFVHGAVRLTVLYCLIRFVAAQKLPNSVNKSVCYAGKARISHDSHACP